MEKPENQLHKEDLHDKEDWAESGRLSKFGWLTVNEIAHLCFPVRKPHFSTEENMRLRRQTGICNRKLREVLELAANEGTILCETKTERRENRLANNGRFGGGERFSDKTTYYIHRANFQSLNEFIEWMDNKGIPPVKPDCLLACWWLNKSQDTVLGIENDGRKRGRREKQVSAFRKICEDMDTPKNDDGLYLIPKPGNIKKIAQDKESGLFSSGWDDFWDSDERRAIAMNPNADKYKSK